MELARIHGRELVRAIQGTVAAPQVAVDENCGYQWSVNADGNVGTAELLNEKMSRIRIGAYRNPITSAKSPRAPRAVQRKCGVVTL